jgi:uncharacterized protein with PIN domain
VQGGRLGRYKEALTAVRDSRGEICEACGAPTRCVHHINPVSETGIDAELVYEPANMMLLCDDCHCLMHPGTRNRNMYQKFAAAGSARGRSLGG